MQRLVSGRLLRVCFLLLVAALPLFLIGCGNGSSSGPAFNIAGTWDVFYVQTAPVAVGQQGPFPFVFNAPDPNSGDFTGFAVSAVPLQSNPITGVESDTNIAFSFAWTDPISLVLSNYHFSGTVNGSGTMAGNWTSDNGLSGTWNAVFVPPLP